MDDIFKALKDPTRRQILEVLCSSPSMSVNELTDRVEMTRFGVMKHLKVLEEASLIKAQQSGREKHLFVNHYPLRKITRWLETQTAKTRETDMQSSIIREMSTLVRHHRFWLELADDFMEVECQIFQYEDTGGHYFRISHLMHGPGMASPYSTSRTNFNTADEALRVAIEQLTSFIPSSERESGNKARRDWFIRSPSFDAVD